MPVPSHHSVNNCAAVATCEVGTRDRGGPPRLRRRSVLIPHLEDAVSNFQVSREDPTPVREDGMFRRDIETTQPPAANSNSVDPVEASPEMGYDAWNDLESSIHIVGPEPVSHLYVLDRFRRAVRHQDSRPSGMAQPITARGRDAEDLRAWPIVLHRFLLNRIDVARDHATVDVKPELATVNASDSTEADLSLANLAVPRAGSAHDLVRARYGLPEFGDLAHSLARRLSHVHDVLRRDHAPAR